MDRLGQTEPIQSLPMNKLQLRHEVIRLSGYFISTVRRAGQMFIPHGSKLIKPGDVLVIVSEDSCVDESLTLSKTILQDKVHKKIPAHGIPNNAPENLIYNLSIYQLRMR